MESGAGGGPIGPGPLMCNSSKNSLDLKLKGFPFRFDQAATRVDDDFVSVGQVGPVTPNSLAKAPLHTIAHDGLADSPRYGKADLPRLIGLCVVDESREKGADQPHTFLIDSLELGSLAKTSERGEALGTRKTGCSGAIVPS